MRQLPPESQQTWSDHAGARAWRRVEPRIAVPATGPFLSYQQPPVQLGVWQGRRCELALAGFTVTLGDRLPQIEAERSGDESAPVMGVRAQQIRKQLSALMNSSYL